MQSCLPCATHFCLHDLSFGCQLPTEKRLSFLALTHLEHFVTVMFFIMHGKEVEDLKLKGLVYFPFSSALPRLWLLKWEGLVSAMVVIGVRA